MLYSKELIKGTLKPIILGLLKNNGRMYGYEITQKVKELSNGKIEITEGALYPLLHKLEAEKLVSVEKEAIGKRVRKYYSLTTQGKVTSAEKVEELSHFLGTVQMIIKSEKSIV
jgi:DNA-binding PadR family transcriptional regulator